MADDRPEPVRRKRSLVAQDGFDARLGSTPKRASQPNRDNAIDMSVAALTALAARVEAWGLLRSTKINRYGVSTRGVG
jgi:hypothetical protein